MSDSVKVSELPQCSFKDNLRASPPWCRDGGEAHYDGKTIYGSWAYMCEEHFSAYGVGLGTGRGQKLILRKEG